VDDQRRYAGLRDLEGDPKAVDIVIELDYLFRAIRPTSLDSIYRLDTHNRDIEAEFARHEPPGTPVIKLDPAYLQSPSLGHWKRKAKAIASTLHHERTHIAVDDIVASGREEEYISTVAERCGAKLGGRSESVPDGFKAEHLIARIPLFASRARRVPPLSPGDRYDRAAVLLDRTAIEIDGTQGTDWFEELIARAHELETTGRRSPFRDPILTTTAEFMPDPSMHLTLLTDYFREAEALEKDDKTWLDIGYLSLEGTNRSYAQGLAEAALSSYEVPTIGREAAINRLQEMTGGFELLSASGRPHF
jgi:hypothetical protein